MWPTETFGAGFAKVEQVKALYIDNLERDLIDVRIRHCTAVNAQSQLFFFARLQEKERAYFNVTGLAYVRPACSEVVSASG